MSDVTVNRIEECRQNKNKVPITLLTYMTCVFYVQSSEVRKKYKYSCVPLNRNVSFALIHQKGAMSAKIK